MNRDEMLSRIQGARTKWDFIIIGGGATGVGTAVDAASRGYKTLLLEQSDFGKGTSSRSTKLAHGGVRYLQQGNVSLVLEALEERGLLLQNAPHLVHNLAFVVPNYDWWEGPFYGIGLKLYDVLAGKYGLGRSQILSKKKTVQYIPTIETKGLRGGVIYYDGQFDDARLVIDLVETAAEQGATVLNYMKVTTLLKKDDFLCGVIAQDMEKGDEYELNAKAVINATGVFTDTIRKMDDQEAQSMISPSQGVHIVLEKSFLPGKSAIMVPHTDDGRVLFAIPWHDRVIVGTTDTPVGDLNLEPKPFKEEIDFLLEHTARYLTKDPTADDILSTFAGLRPLVKSGDEKNTAAISRDHTINISRYGLVTIAGGKWTTYRKMAEETVNQAAVVAGLEAKPCVTRNLNIHGYHKNAHIFGELDVYGADAPAIQDLLRDHPKQNELLHPSFKYKAGEVVWAARKEMARTVEDFLARRTRALLRDARASMEMAPKVAKLMAKELRKNRKWQRKQVAAYTKLAQRYLVN